MNKLVELIYSEQQKKYLTFAEADKELSDDTLINDNKSTKSKKLLLKIPKKQAILIKKISVI